MLSHTKNQNVGIAFYPSFSQSTSVTSKGLQQQLTKQTQILLPVSPKAQ